MVTDDNTVNKIGDGISLLIRHIEMLQVIRKNQPIGIIRLSEMTDIPKHKIRYSLRLLEKEGVISPSSDGAVVTDAYDEYMLQVQNSLKGLRDSIDRIEGMLTGSDD